MPTSTYKKKSHKSKKLSKSLSKSRSKSLSKKHKNSKRKYSNKKNNMRGGAGYTTEIEFKNPLYNPAQLSQSNFTAQQTQPTRQTQPINIQMRPGQPPREPNPEQNYNNSNNNST